VHEWLVAMPPLSDPLEGPKLQEEPTPVLEVLLALAPEVAEERRLLVVPLSLMVVVAEREVLLYYQPLVQGAVVVCP